MSLVDDVQSYLAAQGIVDGATEWPSVRWRLNDHMGDQQVVVTDDGGPQADTPAAEGIGAAAHAFPQVQIRTRGEPWDGDASKAKVRECYEALHGQQAVTMGSTTYLLVTALSEPVFIGFDDDGRPGHTLSVQCIRGAEAPLISA